MLRIIVLAIGILFITLFLLNGCQEFPTAPSSFGVPSIPVGGEKTLSYEYSGFDSSRELHRKIKVKIKTSEAKMNGSTFSIKVTAQNIGDDQFIINAGDVNMIGNDGKVLRTLGYGVDDGSQVMNVAPGSSEEYTLEGKVEQGTLEKLVVRKRNLASRELMDVFEILLK